jgi:hypothetical protein
MKSIKELKIIIFKRGQRFKTLIIRLLFTRNLFLENKI